MQKSTNKSDEPILAPEDPSPQTSLQPTSSTRSRWQLRPPQSRLEWLLTSVGAVIILALLLLVIPYTRYGLLGQVVKRSATIVVVDSRTHKPVSGVTIAIGSQHFTTSALGEVKIAHQPVGQWSVVATKKYYASLATNLTIPLLNTVKPLKFNLIAIGNQVTIKVINKITGHPLASANLAALGTTATTNSAGEAVIVLPSLRSSVAGTVKLGGYNGLATTITNTTSLTPATANTFALTPAGQVYFLDDRTGTLNVMKANLDGTDPQVVLAGTGNESNDNTVLLASRDWKYLALLATRQSNQTGLYLITTATGKLTTIDQAGTQGFLSLTGWDGDSLIYTSNLNNAQPSGTSQAVLKSFNATTGRLVTIDQASTQLGVVPVAPDSGITSSFSAIYILNDGSLLYTKFWSRYRPYYAFPELLAGQTGAFIKVSADGTSRQTLKTIDATKYQFVSSITNQPGQVDFQLSGQDTTGNDEPVIYYNYGNGTISPATATDENTFEADFTPTFLLSPSGDQTLWYEPRDGKNTLFTGNDSAGQPKQIASLSDFTPFGWYTDGYILLSKNQSELYIAPADMSSPPLKITDYHKPDFEINGYGGGYGGQ